MIGLIVTGHGNFASGLTSSLKLIAGEPKNYVAVDFLESYSVDDLERELTKALDELKDCEGVLVLSDLGGGSPFKTAVMVGYPRGNVEVVAGTNLPMLIEAVNLRAMGKDISEIVAEAVENGKEGIHSFMGEYGQSLSVS